MSARVRIISCKPDHKIAAIKCVRGLSGLPLKEAKETVEGTYGDGYFTCYTGYDASILTELRGYCHITVEDDPAGMIFETLHAQALIAMESRQYRLASSILEILIRHE